MSVVTNGWAQVNDNGGTANDGRITVVQPSTYWGRQSRAEAYFNVTGAAGTREIEVSQNGHEFVETSQHNIEIEYTAVSIAVMFYTNSKYFALALSGNDASEYSVSQVYYDQPPTITTPVYFSGNLMDTLEPIGDPGQGNRYRVYVTLITKSNTGNADRNVTISLTGWSGNGNNHYSDYVNITHKCQGSSENENS